MPTTTTVLTLINNNNINNTTAIQTLNTSSNSDAAFCIQCGFDFGHIVNGIDDRVAGLLLLILTIFVVCSPCIIMSFCYMCGHGKKKHEYEQVASSEKNDTSIKTNASSASNTKTKDEDE